MALPVMHHMVSTSRRAKAGGSLNQVQVLSKGRRIKYQVFSRRARLFNPKSGPNGTKPSKKNFAKIFEEKMVKMHQVR
jgi:hypothetical protein